MNEIDEVIYSLRRRRGAIVERIEAMDHAIAALRAVDEMDGEFNRSVQRQLDGSTRVHSPSRVTSVAWC